MIISDLIRCCTTLILLICILAFCFNALLVPFNSLQAPYVSYFFKDSALMLSVLSTMTMIGMISGSILYPIILKKIGKEFLIIGAILCIGFSYILFVLHNGNNYYIIVCVIVAIVAQLLGMGFGILLAVISTILISEINDSYLSRVSAIFNAISAAAMPIMAFLVSVLVKVVKVRDIYILTGICCLILALCVFLNKDLLIFSNDKTKEIELHMNE